MIPNRLASKINHTHKIIVDVKHDMKHHLAKYCVYTYVCVRVYDYL